VSPVSPERPVSPVSPERPVRFVSTEHPVSLARLVLSGSVQLKEEPPKIGGSHFVVYLSILD